ncbi:AMP binding protein [Pluteus cervinus]|uniref:AMP binding protein n=1 Tax=Pluteus cervinus TaxID=181527 RepID=A0ACD3B6U0_9AGAR|nr:AMP binding protein [Pluteus cervinus]
MAPVVYPSSTPSVPVVSTSVYTHLFSASPSDPTSVGGYPGSSPAFIDAPSGTTLTRAQLKNLTLSFAFGIRNHPTTRANVGDTVLIYSQNSLHWPVVLFGCVAAGLRCTLANSGYNARELTYQYNDSKARLVLTTEAGLPVAKEMFKGLGLSEHEANSRLIVLGESLAWAGGPNAPRQAPNLLYSEDLLGKNKLESEVRFDGERAHETLYLCYSSGTTGKPKGVETTHQNITALMDMAKPLFPPAKKLLGILPFYHIYGAVMLLQYPVAANMSVTIQPRFDPVQFCASIEKYNIDIALIVPPVLVVLARHPAVDQYDLSSLSILFSGAAPLGAALTRQVVDRLTPKRKGKGHVHILQGYGLTETSPTSHLIPFEDWSRKMGSCGVLLPNLEARLVIDGDGEGLEDALPGQPGELWLRGPTVMKGYLNNPTATVDAITKDGWFRTGDIATRDVEGFYYIVDRRKELIKYKGFQVPPAELESVLLTHPDVADCAVIGVESVREATELPRAYIVAADLKKVKTPEQKKALELQVQKWITTKVARHKFLRGGVVVIDIIPKSAAGKILRRELRDRAKEELAGRDPGENVRSRL